MHNGNEWEELKNELKVFTRWAISGLIDAAFLALWVLVQWLVNNQVIAKLELSGVDKWVLSAFQFLFAVSTLAPVVVYISVDIIVMILRARTRIRREIEASKVHEPDRA